MKREPPDKGAAAGAGLVGDVDVVGEGRELELDRLGDGGSPRRDRPRGRRGTAVLPLPAMYPWPALEVRATAPAMYRIRDYDYHLPFPQIAQVPCDRRDQSRLLGVGADGCRDRRFADIVELVPRAAVVVVNDTRVLLARLRVHKPSGGRVELLLLEPEEQGAGAGDRTWRCLAKSHRPLRPGTELLCAGQVVARAVRAGPGEATAVVELAAPASSLMEEFGELPLPPYIDRPRGITRADGERYQTVYGRRPGAVAAPTAGLHFTPEIFARLRERGCDIASLTLHVGLGTFAPIRAQRVADHVMHAERYEIPGETARLVRSGRPVVAVGTTVVRALESAAREGGASGCAPLLREAGALGAVHSGKTELFIGPGFRFRAVDYLLTNFHLPRSSLLVLVCAFAGYDRVMAAYRHAVRAGYRFYSYGDAVWLGRERAP